MQQSNIFSYSFSFNERDKKTKQERKPATRKKTINYIDTKYIEREEPNQREEMEKDVVF